MTSEISNKGAPRDEVSGTAPGGVRSAAQCLSVSVSQCLRGAERLAVPPPLREGSGDLLPGTGHEGRRGIRARHSAIEPRHERLPLREDEPDDVSVNDVPVVDGSGLAAGGDAHFVRADQ
jgi:hypothetical protein